MNSSQQFSGQKVLVTGASGFFGSHLCSRLCDAGAEVYAVSRRLHTGESGCMHWQQTDLTEIDPVRQLIRTFKPEVIFHLASHVAGSRNLDLVLPTLQSNLVSTGNLLTAATEVGCRRLVLIGSLEEPATSNNQVTPCSPYAAAKWASSAYGRMFHALYQTPVVIARAFMVYGPGQQDLRKLVPYVTLSLLQGQSPQLASGKRLVDWIYIDDVIAGLLAAAQAPDIDGQTIDIGSGQLTPIRTVVQQITKLINPSVEPLFGTLPDRPLEQVRVADITDSYSKLGWQPLTSLEQGLEQTVNWYRQQLDFLLKSDKRSLIL